MDDRGEPENDRVHDEREQSKGEQVERQSEQQEDGSQESVEHAEDNSEHQHSDVGLIRLYDNQVLKQLIRQQHRRRRGKYPQQKAAHQAHSVMRRITLIRTPP